MIVTVDPEQIVVCVHVIPPAEKVITGRGFTVSVADALKMLPQELLTLQRYLCPLKDAVACTFSVAVAEPLKVVPSLQSLKPVPSSSCHLKLNPTPTATVANVAASPSQTLVLIG